MSFAPSKRWFDTSDEPLTIDGSQLTDAGYARLAPLLADQVFGKAASKAEAHRALVRAAVQEKNWFWHNDYKIPNGVHVFGRRYKPFGPDNYPAEIAKIREMTALRDSAIWQRRQGGKVRFGGGRSTTRKLPPVKTNFQLTETSGNPEYLYGQDALDKLIVAPGYKIELFASEQELKDLAKPVQLSFDNRGRLWVATMPSYPHYKPGDAKPNDKLLILEDTDGDGRADKQTIFAEGLHVPIGFEFAPEGVYVSQGTNLVLLTDTDGDDKADTKEIILSGFDDHDTHHAIQRILCGSVGRYLHGRGNFPA